MHLCGAVGCPISTVEHLNGTVEYPNGIVKYPISEVSIPRCEVCVPKGIVSNPKRQSVETKLYLSNSVFKLKSMKKLRFSQEDIPVIADFVITSFERDKTEFVEHYKTMDDTYLDGFKEANTNVKTLVSNVANVARKKKITNALYACADSMSEKIFMLKDYAIRANLDVEVISKAPKLLRTRNLEGAMKAIRDSLPYYTENIDMLVDMPEGFLSNLSSDITEMYALNVEQNRLINEGKLSTDEARAVYAIVDTYIGEVCRAGRLIFKGTPKADEYMLKKLLSRVRAAKKAKTEAAAEEEETPEP